MFYSQGDFKKSVIIQFNVEGVHYYPGAPSEVIYLEDRHRHTFIVKAGYRVEHTNRDKESFICRDKILSYLKAEYGDPCLFGPMSCEMIAEKILNFGLADGMFWCEVWEEQTGGGRVEI